MDRVEVMVLGTPVLGLWCPACLLSSGVRISKLGLSASGVLSMGTIARCTDCKIQL